MTLQHSPRHRAAGPAGFGRSPWPSQPIAVIPSPRPPSERPGWFRGTAAVARESVPAVPTPREPTAAEQVPVAVPAARHAVPEGLTEVADLATVTSTPAPLPRTSTGTTPTRRTGGAIVRLSVVRSPARAGGGSSPAPSTTASDPWSRGRAMVIGALAVVVVLTGAAATTLLVSGAVSSREAPPASPWAQASARATVAVAPPGPTVASPIATLSGDGRLVVGADIAAGVYRSAGPISPDHDCSWSRRGRGVTGETVLASGVPAGPATVTVRAGDAVFVTRGCAAWTRLSP